MFAMILGAVGIIISIATARCLRGGCPPTVYRLSVCPFLEVATAS